ncbi:MAG: DUF5119 domain-containing protein [Muribaculaceae bacterium]|nr:DUF5119 domain-containing protein [Muribaculaceae bacterium]
MISIPSDFKTQIFRKAASMLLMMMMVLMITACEHREFLMETPPPGVAVTVEFDWSNDPQANPSEMTVYFFRQNSKSGHPIAFDLTGKNGGSVTLTPGIYSAICHNNDSDRHGFTGYDSFDTFGIRLNDNINGSGMHSGASFHSAGDERLAHYPDQMWVGALATVEIEAQDNSKNYAPRIVRFEMLPVVSHYIFYINNPLNFNNSISVSATISGLASTIHPGRGTTGDETVTHLFEMSPTPEGNLFGEILTFGHCGGNSLQSRADEDSGPHILTIHATMSDGQRWNSAHDVTDQIHRSETKDCVIRLDSFSFPHNTGDGAGFSPTVDGWDGSQEPVGM